MVRPPRAALLLLLALPLGCDDEEPAHSSTTSSGSGATGGGPSLTCAPGETPAADGSCIPAGLPPDMPPCPAGEGQDERGGCVAAGVPARACPAGFEAADGGCSPILPASCAPGTMAIPGERACREIAPCGSGTWGDIPVDATTQYVDAAYAGGDSDGSPAKPWTTLTAARDAAEDGALVAVAAGTYDGIVLALTPLRIWGRCPAMVRIHGVPASYGAAVAIGPGAGGTEVHTAELTGEDWGIQIGFAKDVVVDRVWVHDVPYGIDLSQGTPSATIQGSLVEATETTGVFADRGTLSITDSVVRGTADGYGVWLLRGATAAVARSLLEDHRYIGFYVEGAHLDVDASVVRRSMPVDGTAGRALHVQRGVDDKDERPQISLKRSTLSGNHDLAVAVAGADCVVEDTTIVDTSAPAPGGVGTGVLVADDPDTAEPGSVTVRRSLVAGSEGMAIGVRGGELVAERTWVRDVAPGGSGDAADVGIDIENGAATAVATVRESVVEGSAEIGINVNGAELTMDATVLCDNGPEDARQPGGRGLNVQVHEASGALPVATVRNSVIEHNQKSGIRLMGGQLGFEASVIRDTLPSADPPGSYAISVQKVPGGPERGTATIKSSVLENNGQWGIVAWGSDVIVESTLIRTTYISPLDTFAAGIHLLDYQGLASSLSMRWSVLEENETCSLVVVGSDATVENSRFSKTAPYPDGTFGRAVQIQSRNGFEPNVQLTGCLIEDAVEAGVMAVSAHVAVEDSTIRRVLANPLGFGGDGLSVASEPTAGSMAVLRTTVEGSARAGIAAFGGALTLGGATLECNAIDIAAEEYEGFAPAFDDQGANDCGCATERIACAAETTGFVPPGAVAPTPDPEHE